jgi:peptidoglycan/LPS O-acetylase OafA/YrhL
MGATAKPKAKVPKTRLPFLEGMRGLAALYVVLGHICTLSDPSVSSGRTSHAPIWLQRTMACFAYGHLAVAAFIVISGFCLELSLFAREKGVLHSVKRFYLRRAQRILPPYYACLAISIFVAFKITIYQVGAPFNQYLPVDPTTILTHVLLVHNFSTDWMYKINGVLWSIAIEVQLYVLFPFISRSLNRLGRPITLAVAGAAAYAMIALIPQAPKLYFWYLPLFVAGMAAAHLAFKPTKIGRLPIVGTLLAFATAGGCYYAIAQDWPMFASDLFLGVTVAAACYAMTGLVRGPLYRLLVLKPVVSLGTFSYSLYLMHHPIAQVLFGNRPKWVSGEVSLFWYFIGCLPIILLGCWVFYQLFERPFIHRSASKPSAEPKTHAPSGLPLKVYNG